MSLGYHVPRATVESGTPATVMHIRARLRACTSPDPVAGEAFRKLVTTGEGPAWLRPVERAIASPGALRTILTWAPAEDNAAIQRAARALATWTTCQHFHVVTAGQAKWIIFFGCETPLVWR